MTTEMSALRLYEGGVGVNRPWLGAAGGLWVSSGAHVSIAQSALGSGLIGVLVRWCMSKMSRQAARRKGAPAGAKGWFWVVDLGDLGAALAAQAALGLLVALLAVGVFAGVQRRLEQRPAQVRRAVPADRAASKAVAMVSVAIGGDRRVSLAPWL
jgi:hypothetical protein